MCLSNIFIYESVRGISMRYIKIIITLYLFFLLFSIKILELDLGIRNFLLSSRHFVGEFTLLLITLKWYYLNLFTQNHKHNFLTIEKYHSFSNYHRLFSVSVKKDAFCSSRQANLKYAQRVIYFVVPSYRTLFRTNRKSVRKWVKWVH